jgi:hypothetical protein
MFENCTIKYNKDLITNENCSIQVIYPADENGTSRILSVPLATGNTHYQEIMKWVAEGNTIEEAD